MTRHKDRKQAIRARMAATSEPYSTAARALQDDDGDIAAADAIRYDPVADGAVNGGALHPQVVRAMGMLDGAGADCYELAVPDPVAGGGPDGRLAVIARPAFYAGAPVLVVEAVAVTERHSRVPGLWHNGWSIDLHERGWRYGTDGSQTSAWRVDLDPAEGRPSAPAGVKVHDSAGYVLFAGAALLPPGWLVRAARTGPGGLLVLAGPCAGALVPGDLDDGTVEDMLGTADLIAARMPATATGLPAQPVSATARSGAG